MEKKLTGYASIDNPQSIEAKFFEKHPIIPSMDVATLLKLLSAKRKDMVAIDCNNILETYGELENNKIIIAKALEELGVKKGDIVVSSLKSSAQNIELFIACNTIGATTSFLNSYASIEEIILYLNEYESPIFFGYSLTEEQVKKIYKETKVKYIVDLKAQNVDSIIYDGDYHTTCNDQLIDFHSMGSIAKCRKGKLNNIFLPNSKKTDALILYTSGTTGKPKSVVLTNENIIAAQIYASKTSHTENITGPKTMVCVPFSYPYGFVTSALTSLLWGKTTILTPDWGKDTIAYYYGKKPSIVFGSPAVLDLSMKYMPEKQDLSAMTHFISGGDFMTESHAKIGYDFFEKHGATNVEIGNGCGNAETVSIGSTPVGVPLKQSTAGKILVGSTAMIVDPETLEEKKYGEEGLLCISGKHVFKEYYNEPDLTAEAKFTRNGKIFFKTGTLGFIDEDGYFTVTGRQSRFYIRSTGHKVYCDYVQNVISSYSGIKECAVVKVPNEEELYTNKAYIVLNGLNPTEETKRAIYTMLNIPITLNGELVKLKEYEVPREIEFVDELPLKAGTEKVDYKKLEEDAVEELEKAKALHI